MFIFCASTDIIAASGERKNGPTFWFLNLFFLNLKTFNTSSFITDKLHLYAKFSFLAQTFRRRKIAQSPKFALRVPNLERVFILSLNFIITRYYRTGQYIEFTYLFFCLAGQTCLKRVVKSFLTMIFFLSVCLVPMISQKRQDVKSSF